MNDSESVTEAAATTSIIHSAHTKDEAHSPQRGTQTRINISIRVAKPMGTVARKREFVGSWIITRHISGYKMYRTRDVTKARANMTTFRTKNTMEI